MTSSQWSDNFARSILDILPSHVVVLDEKGFIVLHNASWRDFAKNNGYQDSRMGIGTNYLEVCRNAKGRWSEEAPSAHEGILSVLNGRADHYYLEYPCHSEHTQRWFLMRVNRLQFEGKNWTVISHDNITERRLAEIEKESAFLKLKDSIAQIELLEGLIPICFSCKKIRDDQGFWKHVEQFIARTPQSAFTHSLCPDCSQKARSV